MAKCHTDCTEKALQTFFKMMGHFIGSHALWFLFGPLLLSAGLGSGFYFLTDRISNNIEEQFTPVDGPAKMERKYIRENFPENDTMFSSLRQSTDGNYATLIATRDSNILTVRSLQEILNLDTKIKNMVVRFGSKSFQYANICAKVAGFCASNDILDIINYTASNITTVNLTYPWYKSGFHRFPLYINLGSVKLKPKTSVVESAKAVQLYYYLEERNKTLSDLWLESFISLVSNISSPSLKMSYFTSMSRQWEFEKSSESVIFLFSISYSIAITFSIVTCWRLDNVRTKVWVGSCGVLSTSLAVLSGFGALLLMGQPFVMTAASCPFMILGIGLDDMFIMISCWQRTRVLDSVPERLAETYKDAAISITITTLTDMLALFLGCISPFGSVQSFCLYAGICICFCYFYSLTFLGACMALNGQREAENKHWLICAKVPNDVPPGKSKAFSMCCVGGQYDQNTEHEKTEPVSHIFEHFYGPFLTHKVTKACVFGIFAGYLAVSIYGCVILQEGLDIKNLALDDSYIISYYDHQAQHFSEYSLSAMVAIKQPFPYWDPDQQRQLNSCISSFESLNFVDSTIAWFISYVDFANALNLNISSQEAFQTHLQRFLEFNPLFRQDISWTLNGSSIQASRFFIQTLSNSTEKEMLVMLRETAEECPVELLVYHPAFIYFDQYTVIMDNTIQTMFIAVLVMLFVSLILIPNPFCSICVTLAIFSVIAGVAGFMSLWDISLDSISMINLVMCIGFSVDFSAHICYSFVSSPKNDVNEKAIDALTLLGLPVLQGGLSTILGVVVLSASGSYIFRTFFKIVFLVIVFGLLHGLMFIPVFLTLFGACGKRH
ncbi:patched domain-containing protein 3 [Archocentrus centrarchus]|uniref:patched domain-containing protein 3 n=1 Tax=Archocentrus centrarchus TaxID=63155 RepID=UPI0011EA0A02|nr:patched domain-containing protein 3-like [Archocentrus centrarchus]